MELENIILKKVCKVQKVNSSIFSLIYGIYENIFRNINLKQIQQYYEEQIKLRQVTYKWRRLKERS
jgi:hypothetical protein